MNDEQKRDLGAMRIAAEQRQWMSLQDIFKRLLTDLDPLIALSVVAPRVRAFVPRFKRYYPEAGWVEELMLTVVSYASAPGELPVNAVNQFPRPGCGNFVLAVMDLARTVQPKYTVYERFSHVTNAAANAILADLQYTYFKDALELFERLRADETDAETRQRIQYQFWLDDNIAARDTALWLHLVAEVERALERESNG
jgi:hypothetical protein